MKDYKFICRRFKLISNKFCQHQRLSSIYRHYEVLPAKFGKASRKYDRTGKRKKLKANQKCLSKSISISALYLKIFC